MSCENARTLEVMQVWMSEYLIFLGKNRQDESVKSIIPSDPTLPDLDIGKKKFNIWRSTNDKDEYCVLRLSNMKEIFLDSMNQVKNIHGY